MNFNKLKMKNFLKKLFQKKHIRQSIGITKYPNQIIFVTTHQIKNSYTIDGPELSALSSDASDEELGKMVIYHLSLSKNNIKVPSDNERDLIDKSFKKFTGLKTIKAQMKDALYVSVIRNNNMIEFIPTQNGGSSGLNRGFRYLDTINLTVDDIENHKIIGKTLNHAISLCK